MSVAVRKFLTVVTISARFVVCIFVSFLLGNFVVSIFQLVVVHGPRPGHLPGMGAILVLLTLASFATPALLVMTGLLNLLRYTSLPLVRTASLVGFSFLMEILVVIFVRLVVSIFLVMVIVILTHLVRFVACAHLMMDSLAMAASTMFLEMVRIISVVVSIFQTMVITVRCIFLMKSFVAGIFLAVPFVVCFLGLVVGLFLAMVILFWLVSVNFAVRAFLVRARLPSMCVCIVLMESVVVSLGHLVVSIFLVIVTVLLMTESFARLVVCSLLAGRILRLLVSTFLTGVNILGGRFVMEIVTVCIFLIVRSSPKRGRARCRDVEIATAAWRFARCDVNWKAGCAIAESGAPPGAGLVVGYGASSATPRLTITGIPKETAAAAATEDR
ncbi:unnamed protein product [Prorocentrum cordatum]|uniref:Uncharacterized protein n=1 Tax=Prorocentrum cordatum TaxID=2364126 RepID=A0ABN9TBU9_9DINO|nr:unnamed protein product [Polarella glacialis]